DAAESLRLLERAETIFKQGGYEKLVAETWTGIGKVYRYHGENDRAIEAFRRAAEMHHKLEAPIMESLNLQHIGVTYAALGKREDALASLEKAIAIAKDNGRQRPVLQRLSGLGNALIELGEYAKGVATLESVVEKGKGRVPLGTYWYLSEGYYKMGRYDDALAKAKQGVASLRRMGQTENLLQALTW